MPPPEKIPPGTVGCEIDTNRADGHIRIRFDDPEPLDQVTCAVAALSEFAFAEFPTNRPPWRVIRSPIEPGVLAFADSTIDAEPQGPWQSVAGTLAVHRVLRLQRTSHFFHAASIGIGDQGLLLVGPKEAGKTTLALALADRGHAFFGDEMAAVRQTLELLPFRRRLSIRPGPASAGVERALAGHQFPVVTVPDGSVRTRVQPGRLVPATPPPPVRARAVFFLRSKGLDARAEPFAPNPSHLALLPPYESALWGRQRASVALGLLRLLSQLRCWWLDLGSIPETVRLIERLMTEEV